MPTFIKTGFWDKLINNNPQKAKAPIGWLNLDKFVESKIPPPPSSVNIYNSNGQLTSSRSLNGSGFQLDFGNLSSFSVETSTFLTAKMYIDSNTFKTLYNTNDIGLKLDFANSVYQLGQITGGNTKTFKIDDAAAFGFQFSGTGITQATTGAASGQYLKVKIGGNDYVIELKNPS